MSKHDPPSWGTSAVGAGSESDDGLDNNPDCEEMIADTNKNEVHSQSVKRTFEQAAEQEAVEEDKVELALPWRSVAQKMTNLEVAPEDTKLMEEATL